MNTTSILAEIDAEIARLQQVRALLTGVAPIKKPVQPIRTMPITPRRKKRKLSPEGRARIVAAVKARWAKKKKAA